MTTNHPAHGPVSLDRLHQISEILSKASAQSDGGNLGYAMADAVKVIAVVIARELVRREHSVWSQSTFGDVGPIGPLKHLSKEALEAAAEPGDLSEWADMQFLLWDAQRRAGISDEQINQAMVEKLAVNKQREWPEPKDGEPRLHIKELPAPVAINGLLPCPFCGGKAQQLTIEQDNDPHFGGDVITCTECGASSHVEFGFKENLKSAWNSRSAMLEAGNSPVTPDGYILVPNRLTAENGAKGVLSGEFSETKFINCPECFGDDECETCDGSGRIEITVPVTWTTIKAIWDKGVEHFAAAPQQEVK
ncbi:restriction alleviation protein, Lar family [Salmonella enterica]|nr:restriction alleviation protein, Lar family [Salmonella enterica]EEE0369439.1 restriction alleviation protein, Lar family [Salmonella enterica subsp. enterica serovar Javiana]EBA7246319.1 restriction alleviation protein, Lar family [Salmonella enterica]EGF3510863.1 restriction alleviation protein, Lar family [Salmonella enterica]EGM3535306.1 restriction alleviation protein, Lar family [Salmonella enterica]